MSRMSDALSKMTNHPLQPLTAPNMKSNVIMCLTPIIQKCGSAGVYDERPRSDNPWLYRSTDN